MHLLLAVSALLFTPAVLMCQTIVESAILSGSVVASASGSAAATGSAMSRALGNVDASLSRAAGTPAAVPSRATRSVAARPLPKLSQTAFEGIEPGTTTRTELIAKAGKPQFAIASSDDEVLRYTTLEGGSIRIQIVEGKVASIDQTPPKSAATPAPTPPTDPAK